MNKTSFKGTYIPRNRVEKVTDGDWANLIPQCLWRGLSPLALAERQGSISHTVSSVVAELYTPPICFHWDFIKWWVDWPWPRGEPLNRLEIHTPISLCLIRSSAAMAWLMLLKTSLLCTEGGPECALRYCLYCFVCTEVFCICRTIQLN